MELIIAIVLFIALVACWIILPGQSEIVQAHSAAEPAAPAAAGPRV